MTEDFPQDEVDAITLATARRLRALHEELGYPDPGICAWCLKRWPCPDRRWADHVERRAAATGLKPTIDP
jgi:hypothetical protein